jgi:hypothetical protein
VHLWLVLNMCGKINDMKTDNKEDRHMVQLKRIAPRPRQLLSMKLYLGYPTITKGHKLIGVTLVAKPTNAHRRPTCTQTKKVDRHHTYSQPRTTLIGFLPTASQEPNHLDLVNQPDPTSHILINRVKGPCRS